MRKLVIVLLMALLLPLTAQAPATAARATDGSVTVDAQDLSLRPDRCGDATYSVGASFPSAADWSVDITVYDPYGQVAGGDYFSSPETGLSDGTYLCQGLDRRGTYRVVAEYEAYDESYDVVARGSVSTTFRFSTRQPDSSRLTATRTKLGKKSWRIVGTLTREGKPWKSRRVAIQVRLEGDWYDVHAKRTNKRGRVVFTSTPKGKNSYVMRLHSRGGSCVKEAKSRTFRLPGR